MNKVKLIAAFAVVAFAGAALAAPGGCMDGGAIAHHHHRHHPRLRTGGLRRPRLRRHPRQDAAIAGREEKCVSTPTGPPPPAFSSPRPRKTSGRGGRMADVCRVRQKLHLECECERFRNTLGPETLAHIDVYISRIITERISPASNFLFVGGIPRVIQ